MARGRAVALSSDRLYQMPDYLALVFASPVRGVAISPSTRVRSLRFARDDGFAAAVQPGRRMLDNPWEV